MFSSFKRVLKFGWQGFIRNKGLSLQVVFIMAVAVFLITSFFLAKGTAGFLMAEVQKRVDLSVYFKETVTEDEVLEVKGELSKFSEEIQAIEYVSKEMAQALFQEDHKADDLWLEALEEVEGNPFPASLNIKSDNPVHYATISSFLEASDFSDMIGRISYNQAKNQRAIERLFDLNTALKIGGIAFILIVGVLIILITSNIIKLTIVARQEELTTMRLVGASNWFVKGPFLVQSILYGLFAVVAVNLLFFGGLYLFNANIQTWLLRFDLLGYFQVNFLSFLSFQFVFVVLLGMLSSLVAVRKYSKA